MRLLLVDDDRILRTLVGDYLTREGHHIETAADGTLALLKIADSQFDAVISDWEMPQMDGASLCRAIRQGLQNRDLYFIMLTGRDSVVAEVEGFAAGIDAFLSKPCKPVDLLAAIRLAQSLSIATLRVAA